LVYGQDVNSVGSSWQISNITVSPFDTYIQIIDGTAELNINHKKHELKLGDGIIIPAHAKHNFSANEQFKMLSTVIKSGYED
jgi:quercetin dioxygenase-like cupin family protein